jgi:hypothetical protein
MLVQTLAKLARALMLVQNLLSNLVFKQKRREREIKRKENRFAKLARARRNELSQVF